MPVFEVDSSSELTVTAVRFSNGSINETSIPVTSYVRKDDVNTGSLRQQILTTEVDGLSYVGKNFGATSRFSDDTCDYYMGIHDKTTGKIRVVPASLIQLEPWFDDKEAEGNDLFHNKSFREKSDALATEFGSGRSQRAVSKRTQNKLEDEMVASSAQNALDSTDLQDALQDAGELVSQSGAIPPYNPDATTPEEVYKLKDLISVEVLKSLAQVSTHLTSCTSEDLAQWRKENKYFSFVLNKLAVVSPQAEARQFQGQCLAYLQYMMELYVMKAFQLRSRFPLPKEWPQAVRDHLLQTFTQEIKEPGRKFRRCVPQHLKDLLLSHILVLCLKMSEFSLDVSPLSCDLKHAAKKLASHATYLGCKSKKVKQGDVDVYTVTLKVPFTLPTMRDKVNKNRIR